MLQSTRFRVRRCLLCLGFALLTEGPRSLSAQTPPVSLRIETENGGTKFRLGETIGIKATFETTAPQTWRVEISGRDRPGISMGFDRFLVSPEAGTDDPQSYRFAEGFTGSGLGGWSLSDKPLTATLDLNQWVRFQRPGYYRIRAVFHATSMQPTNHVFGALEFESNDLGLEISAGDPARMAQQLQADTALLDSAPNLPDDKSFEARMNAARRIWYLDTPDSLRAAARLLGTADTQVGQLLQTALRGTLHRDQAIAAMQSLLPGPDQAVTPAFLDTLAELRALQLFPPQANLPPASAQGRYEARVRFTRQLRADLAAVLEKKRGKAKALSLKTLLDDMLPDSIPDALRAEIAFLFPDLPPGQQAELLGPQWKKIAGPAMIPVLRRIYDTLPQQQVYQAFPLAAVAVEDLYELDPVQARQLILDEMRGPLRLPFRTLAILPDATLPALDKTFADHLEHSRDQITLALIARYGTAAILSRVKASRPPLNACEPAFVAYFLRVEPAWGDTLLRASLAERGNPRSSCWFLILPQTALYYSGPEWEKVAVEALEDPSVDVKSGVVSALARYGSAASEAPVWKAFSYWHDWWKSRPADLNEENRHFERTFLEAFHHPKNWPVTASDFDKVRDLCITQDCKTQAAEYQRDPR